MGGFGPNVHVDARDAFAMPGRYVNDLDPRSTRFATIKEGPRAGRRAARYWRGRRHPRLWAEPPSARRRLTEGLSLAMWRATCCGWGSPPAKPAPCGFSVAPLAPLLHGLAHRLLKHARSSGICTSSSSFRFAFDSTLVFRCLPSATACAQPVASASSHALPFMTPAKVVAARRGSGRLLGMATGQLPLL